MIIDQNGCTAEPDRSSAAAPEHDQQLECYTTAKARKDRFYRGKPCPKAAGNVARGRVAGSNDVLAALIRPAEARPSVGLCSTAS
jgi:hypothetical protein